MWNNAHLYKYLVFTQTWNSWINWEGVPLCLRCWSTQYSYTIVKQRLRVPMFGFHSILECFDLFTMRPAPLWYKVTQYSYTNVKQWPPVHIFTGPLYGSHCMVPIVWKSAILPHLTTMVSRQRCRIYDLLTLLYQARIAQQLSLDGWQPWRPHLALVEYVESHLLDRVGQENMRRHVDQHQMSRSYKAIIWHHRVHAWSTL